jgi:hypothetical protein
VTTSPADHQTAPQRVVITLKKRLPHLAGGHHQIQTGLPVVQAINTAAKEPVKKSPLHLIANLMVAAQAVTISDQHHPNANLTPIIQAATIKQEAVSMVAIKKVLLQNGLIQVVRQMAKARQAIEKVLLHAINPIQAG